MKKQKQIYLVRKHDGKEWFFVVCNNPVEALASADHGEEIYTADNLKKFGKAEMVIK